MKECSHSFELLLIQSSIQPKTLTQLPLLFIFVAVKGCRGDLWLIKMHTLHKRFIRSIASVHLWNSNTFSPNLCTFVLHNFASSGNDDYLATPPYLINPLSWVGYFPGNIQCTLCNSTIARTAYKNLYIHSLARVGQWLILCPWRPQGTSLQKLLGYSRRLGGSSIQA